MRQISVREWNVLAVAIVLAGGAACDRGTQPEVVGGERAGLGRRLVSRSVELPRAAAADSDGSTSIPRLTVMDSFILLSWAEGSNDDFAWYYSENRPDPATGDRAWSVPCTLKPTDGWLPSPVDPAWVLRTGDRSVASVWTRSNPAGRFASDVVLGNWNDGEVLRGEKVHDDVAVAEHAFASAAVGPGGAIDLVWLDGRSVETDDRTELRHRTWAAGSFQPEVVLDDSVCSCCTTAISETIHADGTERLAVAYRDRSPDEVRDIRVAVRESGNWLEPILVHADGWHIPGCPVNGPALNATERGWVVAWFSGADDHPSVRVAFGDAVDRNFDAPIVVHDKPPLGHTAIAALLPDEAIVAWVASGSSDPALRARWVHRDGRLGPILDCGPISGKPSMVAGADGEVWLAWTEPLADDASRIRLERVEAEL